MSILRRLLLSITIAISAILLGTLALSISAARDYLAGQLQAQSTDAAVSLALSLSQPGNDEPIMQELLISAMFDGGHFTRITLTSPERQTLFTRQIEGTPRYAAPGWFRATMPIGTKSATHPVTDGWRQIGDITVVANDSYAWETLWESSLRMILLVVAAGLAWAIFAFALVRWIERRLLAEISEQVQAIGKGQLVGDAITARVPELSGITQALNQAREQLRITAAEQHTEVEALKVELNRDPVTGTANRRYFLNEFRRALNQAHASPADGQHGHGHVLVFRQRDLAEINRHMHRELTDQWLASVCKRLNEVLEDAGLPQALFARLNGSDFAILMQGCETPAAMMLAERLRTELLQMRIPVGEGALCRWVQALTDYGPDANIGDVLARLDEGLMRAESAGADSVNFVADSRQQGTARGEIAWRDTITQALRDHGLALSTSPLFTVDGGGRSRQEASLVMRESEDRQPIPAAMFIPPAVRLNLVGDCDLEAVRLGLGWLRRHDDDLTVRLALPSLRHEGFIPQLQALFATQPDEARRLILEIDAHGLVEQYEGVAMLCRAAAAAGVRIGLRRLAQQFGALTRLQGLAFDYAKISGGLVTELANSQGSQTLAASVISIARDCGIDVYAEDVPDAATRDILAGLGVKRMRGPGVPDAAQA